MQLKHRLSVFVVLLIFCWLVAGCGGAGSSNGSSILNPTPSATSLESSPTPTPASSDNPAPTVTPTAVVGRTITCSTSTQIQNALKNAQPGDTIIIKAGTYLGNKSTSGNSGSYFYSGANGTATAHIIVKSEQPDNQAILQGSDNSTGYVFYLTGDYWEVRDLKFTNAKKGIMMDNSNYSLIYNCRVYDIGEEGIHLRDGSSNNTIENCNVYNTGTLTPDYGEAVYVGSDYKKWPEFADDPAKAYIKECDNNTVKGCTLGPNVAAEHVDIKEGTTGTIVEGCTFNATGMTGANGGDSFIDAKGNNAIIRNNIGYRNGNVKFLDAFQVNQKQPGWGLNNDFYDNTVYLDIESPFVVKANGEATAKAHNNTRYPASGNMYSGKVTQY